MFNLWDVFVMDKLMECITVKSWVTLNMLTWSVYLGLLKVMFGDGT